MLSKDFQERIYRAQCLNVEVVQEKIISPNEMHLFHVRKKRYVAKGYTMTILEFPRYFCKEFMQRHAKKGVHIPCTLSSLVFWY